MSLSNEGQNKKREYKQSTLSKFNFTKKLKSLSGDYVEINLPTIAKEECKKLKCPHCIEKFTNQQGLTVHIKCIHGTSIEVRNNNCKISFDKEKRIETENEVTEQQSVCVSEDEDNVIGKKKDLLDEENSSNIDLVREESRMNTADIEVVIDDPDLIDEPQKSDRRKGAIKRKVYSQLFKAEAIYDFE